MSCLWHGIGFPIGKVVGILDGKKNRWSFLFASNWFKDLNSLSNTGHVGTCRNVRCFYNSRNSPPSCFASCNIVVDPWLLFWGVACSLTKFHHVCFHNSSHYLLPVGHQSSHT